MSMGDCSRSCIVCVLAGLCIGILFHSVFTILTGQHLAWYITALAVGPVVILWVAFRIVKERIASREYNKLVEARRRRSHLYE